MFIIIQFKNDFSIQEGFQRLSQGVDGQFDLGFAGQEVYGKGYSRVQVRFWVEERQGLLVIVCYSGRLGFQIFMCFFFGFGEVGRREGFFELDGGLDYVIG